MKQNANVLETIARSGRVLGSSWSPDEKQIAFLRMEDNRTEVYLTDAASYKNVRRLTTCGVAVPEQGDAGPSWSPIGDAIVTLSPSSNGIDVVEVSVRTGEVLRLTDGYLVCSSPRYSPNGQYIAFIVSKKAELRTLGDPPPVWDVSYNDHDPAHLSGLLGNKALWIMSREGSTIKRFAIPGFSVLEFVWHPDSGQLIASSYDAQRAQGHLAKISLESGVGTPHFITTQGDYQDRSSAISCDGRVAFLSNRTGVFEVWIVEGNEERQITFDGCDKAEVAWHHTGTSVIYTIFTEGQLLIESLPINTNNSVDATRITTAGIAAHLNVSAVENRLLFLYEAANHTPDLCVTSPELSHTERLTHSGVVGYEESLSCHYTPHRYASHNNLEIEGFLALPSNRQNTPPPVVIYPHGGPTSVFLRGWHPFLNWLALNGFAIFAPNFRGSTGYGKAFEQANDYDWGGGDLQDVVLAVDYLGKKGLVNSNRAAIFGGSYGGYLTLLALAKYPSIFRCGIDLYGVSNRYSSWLTTDRLGRFNMEKEMGHMATRREAYHEASPIHLVNSITAPLLILHGEDDPRVPVSQSDELTDALKKVGKFHLYHKYPGEGHGFRRPEHQIDVYQHITAFLTNFL